MIGVVWGGVPPPVPEVIYCLAERRGFPRRCLTKWTPPGKEVTWMKEKAKSQLLKRLALTLLLGALARLLEALADIIRMIL